MDSGCRVVLSVLVVGRRGLLPCISGMSISQMDDSVHIRIYKALREARNRKPAATSVLPPLDIVSCLELALIESQGRSSGGQPCRIAYLWNGNRPFSRLSESVCLRPLYRLKNDLDAEFLVVSCDRSMCVEFELTSLEWFKSCFPDTRFEGYEGVHVAFSREPIIRLDSRWSPGFRVAKFKSYTVPPSLLSRIKKMRCNEGCMLYDEYPDSESGST